MNCLECVEQVEVAQICPFERVYNDAEASEKLSLDLETHPPLQGAIETTQSLDSTLPRYL